MHGATMKNDISGFRRDSRCRTVFFWDITQRVVVIATPETSVRGYHCSLLNKTEDRTTLLPLTNPHVRAKGVFVVRVVRLYCIEVSLLQNLTIPGLLKKFPTFYVTQNSVTFFHSCNQLPLY